MQIVSLKAFFAPWQFQAGQPESLTTKAQAQQQRMNHQREHQRGAHPSALT
jgi:hypothetical protein